MHQISAQRDAIGFFTKLVFMEKMAQQDDYVRYTIRVPKEPYAAIEKAAKQAGRSMNAEIVQRLSESIVNDGFERLVLDLPEDTMKDLSLSAIVYDQSIEEYVMSVVRRDVERLAEYQTAFEEMEDLRSKIYALEDENKKLRVISDSDFSTFYLTIMLQWTMTQTVLRYRSQLPADVVDDIARQKKAAENMIQKAEKRLSTIRAHQSSDERVDDKIGLQSKITELLRQATHELGLDKPGKDSAA